MDSCSHVLNLKIFLPKWFKVYILIYKLSHAAMCKISMQNTDLKKYFANLKNQQATKQSTGSFSICILNCNTRFQNTVFVLQPVADDDICYCNRQYSAARSAFLSAEQNPAPSLTVSFSTSKLMCQ